MSMASFIFRLMFKHSMCIQGEQTVPCQTVLLTAGSSHPFLGLTLTLPGQCFLLLNKSIWLLTSPQGRDIWFLFPCSLWVNPIFSPLAAGNQHVPVLGQDCDTQHSPIQAGETAPRCFVHSVNLRNPYKTAVRCLWLLACGETGRQPFAVALQWGLVQPGKL